MEAVSVPTKPLAALFFFPATQGYGFRLRVRSTRQFVLISESRPVGWLYLLIARRGN
jgi:hypothetical protein